MVGANWYVQGRFATSGRAERRAREVREALRNLGACPSVKVEVRRHALGLGWRVVVVRLSDQRFPMPGWVDPLVGWTQNV